MYRRIVAGTDLSATARVATDRSAWLARELGAELLLVHVGSDPGAALEELAESYGASVSAVPGNPAETLIDEARRAAADLLVVGSVGMRGARRFMLGNVPNKVSHHALTDLLIVKTDPPSSRSPYRRLLVGTDGSDTAMRAVDTAARLAASAGLQTTVVCAYDPPAGRELEALRLDPNDPLVQWQQDRDALETPPEFKWRIPGATQAADVLDRAAERVAGAGVEAETRALEGPAADVLIDLAGGEDFDVVVVGNVGMTGTQRFMLGNVPHRVSHHSPVDVLIVRTA